MSAGEAAHELLARALQEHIANARAAAGRVKPRAASARRGPKVAAEAAPVVEEDGEAVHDLRVALRRIRTTLKPARRIYGEKKLRSIGADLKRFADMTSALRDEEVLRETLTALTLASAARRQVDAWITRRSRQERARRARVVRALASGLTAAGAIAPAGADGAAAEGVTTLEQCFVRLEKRLSSPKRETGAAELGKQAIAEARSALPALGEADTSDAAAMHDLRIRFKRLRYTAETFKPALLDGAERVASEASKLQSSLGKLHDLDEALVSMARAWGLPAAPRKAVLDALRRARLKLAARCKTELQAAEIALGEALSAPC